jgi:uncharacterized protein with GYD domain
MEPQTEKMIKMVDEIRKRFDTLGIKYISLGQVMGQYMHICASQDDLELIKKFLLQEEMDLSILTKSIS